MKLTMTDDEGVVIVTALAPTVDGTSEMLDRVMEDGFGLLQCETCSAWMPEEKLDDACNCSGGCGLND